MDDFKLAGYASREEAIIARARRILGGDESADDLDSTGETLTGELLDAVARDISSGALDSPAIAMLSRLKTVAPADDCAVWRAGAFDLLSTTHTLDEGTHFLLPDRENHLRERILALDALGWKSLAVNISDI